MTSVPEQLTGQLLTTELLRFFSEKSRIKDNVSAASLTTFGVGGVATCVVEPRDLLTLGELVCFFRDRGVNWRTIGAGSNVIFPDHGVIEPVVRLGKEFGQAFVIESELEDSALVQLLDFSDPKSPSRFEQGRKEELYILALSGCSLMNLSRKCTSAGLSGLEFAAGIPATLGGAVVMNAGAHGSCLAEVLRRVIVLEPSGEVSVKSHQELEFSYRHSNLNREQFVIGAELVLRRGDMEEIAKSRKSCLDYRKQTQPLHMPSAGSVFRNPRIGDEPLYAAKMIEEVGLKGMSADGVSFSDLHANWLVKVEASARCSGVVQLVELAQERVLDHFGVKLQPEIKIWD